MPEEVSKQPIELVNITSPALNSRLGRYFIAQTGLLNFGNGYNAWGGIINPFESGVNLYIDIFTITNYSTQSFIGEIWLDTDAPIIAVGLPNDNSIQSGYFSSSDSKGRNEGRQLFS